MDRQQREINRMCEKLHKVFNALPRFDASCVSELPFDNGIYILFEKGEKFGELDRIVRVGTHTSDHRLKTRLKDHFLRKNHDGSIFRKNIGKAILNAEKDPYLVNWTTDTSKRENKHFIIKEKNDKMEDRVSEFLKDNMTFTAFKVDTKEQRLRFEEAIISTLNYASNFYSSENWFGKNSPEQQISSSGLWLRQGLNGKELTLSEFKYLVNTLVRQSF